MEADAGFCVNLNQRVSALQMARHLKLCVQTPQAATGHCQHGNIALQSYEHHRYGRLPSLIFTFMSYVKEVCTPLPEVKFGVTDWLQHILCKYSIPD